MYMHFEGSQIVTVAVFPLGSKSNRVVGERLKPEVGEGMGSS